MCLVGEAGSALIASASQNITSSLAGHTFEKSMFTRALALFGLVGALWHVVLSRILLT